LLTAAYFLCMAMWRHPVKTAKPLCTAVKVRKSPRHIPAIHYVVRNGQPDQRTKTRVTCNLRLSYVSGRLVGRLIHISKSHTPSKTYKTHKVTSGRDITIQIDTGIRWKGTVVETLC
jgi:hypothetical protein